MLGAVQGIINWVPLGLPAWLFVVTVVVFFHELGHFLAARACGVRVETFSIGFGRELVGWNDRYGTRWKISLLPFGGYVAIAGMNPKPAICLTHWWAGLLPDVCWC